MQTPYYLIHRERFVNNCNDIIDSFQKEWCGKVGCGYSVKTNNHPIMLQLAFEKGLYAEVVSATEYKLAKQIGFDDNKIIYNGPVKGKTVYNAYELGAKINIDNLVELNDMIMYIQENRTNRRGIGLRINFDLEKEVPGETATGEEVGRFGICLENGDFNKALQLLRDNEIMIEGLHIHYTTQSRSINVYRAIANKIVQICRTYGIKPQYIDIGGGFWGGRVVPGKPTMCEYAQNIVGILQQEFLKNMELIVEPGSAMCATVVDYHTTVISTKDIRGTRIVVVDGSSLNINPFMNKRNQTVMYPLDEKERPVIQKQEICGATCLEKDRFKVAFDLGELRRGDEIVFTNAGAYTMSLLSDFIVQKPETYVVD